MAMKFSLEYEREAAARAMRASNEFKAKAISVFWRVAIPAFALLFAYVQYDLAFNYLPVEARVTQAEEQCQYHATKKNGRLWLLGLMPCDRARDYFNADPGSTMKKYYVVMVDYTSPADHEAHNQRLVVAAETVPGGEVHVGTVLRILASRKEPYTVMR